MAEVNQGLFRVLRELGANEDQAFTGATHDDVITGLRSDVADIKSDMKLLKWMLSLTIAIAVAILLRVYV